MTLSDALDAVERRRKTITVYAPTETTDLVAGFDVRNAAVEYRSLPDGGDEGFVVIRDRDGFVGSIGLAELADLLAPPIFRPWNEAVVTEEYRALFELLENTLFASLDRRQLLAAAREIENRAWRVGHGTLRVGFQRLSAMRDQLPVYSRLGSETTLEIHVYGREDWQPPSIPNATVHAVEDARGGNGSGSGGDEIGRFWFLVFDDGDAGSQQCALVAEQRSDDEYYGFWTYDADLVSDLEASVREIEE